MSAWETGPAGSLYGRLLRLHHIRPSSGLCFALCEGSVLVAALLAFAELTTWWALLILPMSVAGMVKINDLVVGLFPTASGRARTAPCRGAPGSARRHPGMWRDHSVNPAPRTTTVPAVGRMPLAVLDPTVGCPTLVGPRSSGPEFEGRLYGSPRPEDEDATPAVGCVRQGTSWVHRSSAPEPDSDAGRELDESNLGPSEDDPEQRGQAEARIARSGGGGRHRVPRSERSGRRAVRIPGRGNQGRF